jgi:hypothetical protein
VDGHFDAGEHGEAGVAAVDGDMAWSICTTASILLKPSARMAFPSA